MLNEAITATAIMLFLQFIVSTNFQALSSETKSEWDNYFFLANQECKFSVLIYTK